MMHLGLVSIFVAFFAIGVGESLNRGRTKGTLNNPTHEGFPSIEERLRMNHGTSEEALNTARGNFDRLLRISQARSRRMRHGRRLAAPRQATACKKTRTELLQHKMLQLFGLLLFWSYRKLRVRRVELRLVVNHNNSRWLMCTDHPNPDHD